MDQEFQLRLDEYRKALSTLDAALKEKQSDIVRDSVIKRFEYSFELAWKTAKSLLRTHYGVDIFSPKECFRALRSNQLISDEETEQLLMMTDDRNEIIHTYKEQFADDLHRSITSSYASLLRKLLQQMEVIE